MNIRARASVGTSAAMILVTSLEFFGAAQAQSSGAANHVEEWAPPRTPWGDPDISGDFTNKYEIGTPMERPARYEGRRLEDFTAEELAQMAQARQELVLLNYPHQYDPENPAGNLGGPNTWGDRFEIFRGRQPWFVIDPPNGQLPPRTAEASEAQGSRTAADRNEEYVRGPEASWDEWISQQDASLYDRCITRGYPGSMMPVSYGNSYHILQTPEYVAIRYEMVHETRIIPLDGRPHAPETIRSYMGNARGHWEGETLVVETTNLRTGFRGANAETLRVVERFTRLAPDTVEWQATIDDPATWEDPWTFAIPLTQNESERIQEYACHAGNYSMPMRLRAARKAELEADQAGVEGRPEALRRVLLDEDEQRIQQELREREDRLEQVRQQ